ncbi:MAG: 4-(cytidine 5'-diphospho)-2-C-methyl-D-erythritol kinase [Lachnospiraceae bacterium]|nr:4-(cytidine 5'-diphospho)-2-C-methyl-D-erythritol kinase [Lachnospiraceae bacterium]
MNKVVRKAYGKVNLGLDVLGTLPNGYHEVAMILQTVNLYDTVTIEKASEGIRLTIDRDDLPVDTQNLAYRAAEKILAHGHVEGGVKIDIRKRIPVAAGMAGGSTDAAAVLVGINELYDLQMSNEKLCELGVQLGADVPYCIYGGTMLAEGIGEKLTALVKPPKCTILLAKPQRGVSTKYVYDHLDLTQTEHPDMKRIVANLKAQDLAEMSYALKNVLESVTGKEVEEIPKIEKVMMEAGALCSLMSGSGPTVFGIFENSLAARKAARTIEKKALAADVIVTSFVDPSVEESK